MQTLKTEGSQTRSLCQKHVISNDGMDHWLISANYQLKVAALKLALYRTAKNRVLLIVLCLSSQVQHTLISE